jgi:hypothetical protein
MTLHNMINPSTSFKYSLLGVKMGRVQDTSSTNTRIFGYKYEYFCCWDGYMYYPVNSIRIRVGYIIDNTRQIPTNAGSDMGIKWSGTRILSGTTIVYVHVHLRLAPCGCGLLTLQSCTPSVHKYMTSLIF